jgi:hypothetical protein
MKTYNQFVTEAYTINEFNVGDFARDRVKDVRQGFKDFRQNPLRSVRQGAMGLGKYEVKSQAVQPVIRTLKRATGNKPVTNAILDTAGLVAPSLGWRSVARAAGPLVKPALAAGALILATPQRAGGYDQVTGPNAYYNNPGLKKNQTPKPRIRAGY